jgi:sporulation protein YlmC with PRC-barrel domain
VPDPVSWLVIEPGWTVVARDGTDVGRVEEVVGDLDDDIFNGLAVTSGVLGRPKYIPAERVAEIVEGEVRLDLAPESVEQLDPHNPQPPAL